MKIKILKEGKWDSYECLSGSQKIYLKPSAKLNCKFEVGKEYDVEVFKPIDKKTTYITKINSQEVSAPSAAPVDEKHIDRTVEKESYNTILQNKIDELVTTKEVLEKQYSDGYKEIPEGKPTQEYWEKKEAKQQSGLAQGNYRAILGTFLTQSFCREGSFPSDEEIIMFNKLLKEGEQDYFKSYTKDVIPTEAALPIDVQSDVPSTECDM